MLLNDGHRGDTGGDREENRSDAELSEKTVYT
jgi:hypothetical protein